MQDLCIRCIQCNVLSAHLDFLRFASCVTIQQNATFLWVAHPSGGYNPQIQTLLRFLYDAPTHKYRVDKQTHKPTNKQILAKTSTVLCYDMTLGNRYYH